MIPKQCGVTRDLSSEDYPIEEIEMSKRWSRDLLGRVYDVESISSGRERAGPLKRTGFRTVLSDDAPSLHVIERAYLGC